MSDNKKSVSKGTSSPSAAPSGPPLPSSSGAWFGNRTQIIQKDADFVRAHADFLRARAEQSHAMRELIDSRIGLAKTMAKLTALGEIVEHEFRLGCRERNHELRLATINQETEALAAQIALAEVQAKLATLAPHGTPPVATATTPDSYGLTPDEIEELLQALPEISPDTLHTLSLMLKGRLKEKSR